MRPWMLILLLAPVLFGGDDAAAQKQAQKRAAEACAEMSRHIEAYLGPRFPGPVPVRIVDTEFIGKFAHEMAKQMAPQGLIETSQRLAERLHQVPKGYDIQAKQIEMVKKVVAGLYDPLADRFYLVKGRADPGTPGGRQTLCHELVHAYRDVDHKYYEKTVGAVLDDVDWAIAMSCLTEGDATFLAYGLTPTFGTQVDPERVLGAVVIQCGALADRPRPQVPAMAEFPRVLQEIFAGRYVIGLVFASKVYAKGGKQALAAAFVRPPRSTEQVLHPEKYLADTPDEPTVFSGGDPTAALGDGWKMELSSTVGEFELQVQFIESLGFEAASRAAAGWDGARFWFCTKKGVPAFYGAMTTWDSEKDAVEFADAWAAWAAKRDGNATEVEAAGHTRRVRTKQGLVVVRVAGRDVMVADGVDPARADAVIEAMRKVQRRDRKADEEPAAPK